MKFENENNTPITGIMFGFSGRKNIMPQNIMPNFTLIIISKIIIIKRNLIIIIINNHLKVIYLLLVNNNDVLSYVVDTVILVSPKAKQQI